MEFMDTNNRTKVIKDDNDDQKLGIHEDLVVEILSKLCVKDVLQCRYVSKHWLALTKSSFFIMKHLLHHHHHHDDDLSRMIFISFVRNKKTRVTAAFSVVSEKKTLNFPVSFFQKHLFSYNPVATVWSCCLMRLIGSSNGLVCFNLMHKIIDEEKYQSMIIVWNPLTLHFRILPTPDADSNIPFKHQDEKDDIIPHRELAASCSPYIGLDSVQHYDDDGIMIATEYKLVRVFAHHDHSRKEKTTIFRAQVFVQNTNSWEPVKNELEFTLLEHSYPTTSITLNGFMYWKVTRKGGKCGVVSFDIRHEVFTVVKLPLTLQIQRHWGVLSLFEWKDSLAIAAFEYTSENLFSDYILVLWTTKDSVWTPQFRLDSSFLPKGRVKRPLGSWQDRFLFSITRDDEQVDDGSFGPASLFSYDPKTELSEEYIIFGGEKISLSRSGVNYVPTLAPV